MDEAELRSQLARACQHGDTERLMQALGDMCEATASEWLNDEAPLSLCLMHNHVDAAEALLRHASRVLMHASTLDDAVMYLVSMYDAPAARQLLPLLQSLAPSSAVRAMLAAIRMSAPDEIVEACLASCADDHAGVLCTEPPLAPADLLLAAVQNGSSMNVIRMLEARGVCLLDRMSGGRLVIELVEFNAQLRSPRTLRFQKAALERGIEVVEATMALSQPLEAGWRPWTHHLFKRAVRDRLVTVLLLASCRDTPLSRLPRELLEAHIFRCIADEPLALSASERTLLIGLRSRLCATLEAVLEDDVHFAM